MLAVRSRNCATIVQFPAATSCSSAIMSETKANTHAVKKDNNATVYSNLRVFIEKMVPPEMGGTYRLRLSQEDSV